MSKRPSALLAQQLFVLLASAQSFYSFNSFLLQNKSLFHSTPCALPLKQPFTRSCVRQGDQVQCVYPHGETKRRPASDLQPGFLCGTAETRAPAGLHGPGPQQHHPPRWLAGWRVRPADGRLWAENCPCRRLPAVTQLPEKTRCEPLVYAVKAVCCHIW